MEIELEQVDKQHVAHDASRFILDFKGLFPQFSKQGNPTMVIEHKIVLLEPHNLKSFIECLQIQIKKYESTFGKIEIPKAVQKQEKEIQKSAAGETIPEYLG